MTFNPSNGRRVGGDYASAKRVFNEQRAHPRSSLNIVLRPVTIAVHVKVNADTEEKGWKRDWVSRHPYPSTEPVPSRGEGCREEEREKERGWNAVRELRGSATWIAYYGSSRERLHPPCAAYTDAIISLIA